MAFLIRRATLEDGTVLVALWQELYEFHLALDSRSILAPGAKEHWRERVVELLKNNNCCLLVAEERGTVVGFISGAVTELPPIRLERVQGYIEDAVVTAACRERGIGRGLFLAMAEWFRERGVTDMGLSAAVANPVSQAFWHKMGFSDYMIRMRGELK